MIPVYDAVNRERLLGFVPTLHMKPYHGLRAYYAQMRPIEWRRVVHDEFEMSINRIELQIEQRHTNNGWNVSYVLLACAPLSELSAIPGWRFPERGER